MSDDYGNIYSGHAYGDRLVTNIYNYGFKLILLLAIPYYWITFTPLKAVFCTLAALCWLIKLPKLTELQQIALGFAIYFSAGVLL